jgi:hypothetical protein
MVEKPIFSPLAVNLSVHIFSAEVLAFRNFSQHLQDLLALLGDAEPLLIQEHAQHLSRVVFQIESILRSGGNLF